MWQCADMLYNGTRGVRYCGAAPKDFVLRLFGCLILLTETPKLRPGSAPAVRVSRAQGVHPCQSQAIQKGAWERFVPARRAPTRTCVLPFMELESLGPVFLHKQGQRQELTDLTNTNLPAFLWRSEASPSVAHTAFTSTRDVPAFAREGTCRD